MVDAFQVGLSQGLTDLFVVSSQHSYKRTDVDASLRLEHLVQDGLVLDDLLIFGGELLAKLLSGLADHKCYDFLERIHVNSLSMNFNLPFIP